MEAFIIVLVFIAIGYVVGKGRDAAHFRSIERREADMADMILTDLKTPPAGQSWSDGRLVTGTTVIATDYFKVFVAGLRNLIGGEHRGLKKLQDRARRESILRMLDQARRLGATAVCNVRIETSTIGGQSKNQVAQVELLAYGTALIPAPGSAAPPSVPSHPVPPGS